MILCLTHSSDYYTVDIVQQQLESLGKRTLRLNTDLFSHELPFHYTCNNSHKDLYWSHGDTHFNTREIEGVWYRKLWSISPPADLDPGFSGIYTQEYITMRNIFFDALRHLPWMNPMNIDHETSRNKLEQLHMASRNGLRIPKSLFTNSPEKARTFFHDECQGLMIAKLHGSLSRSMRGDAPFFPTTAISGSDLEQLDTLPLCPMIFQELIPRLYELRVIYVDGTFFTGMIDAGNSVRGRTDWRVATDTNTGWEPYKLPENICMALTRTMKQAGLPFGAIDLIRHRNGDYVFLEINPQGEWGMLQRDLGYPIGQTIAEKLIARL